jgi:hypothetical protein
MNKWKIFAIILALITFGAINETLRIMTSKDLDIAMQRTELTIMSVIFTIVLAFFTIKLWLKGSQTN